MGFHVKQDITVFRPYHNNYAFFMRSALEYKCFSKKNI